jgi:hypothetical protein
MLYDYKKALSATVQHEHPARSQKVVISNIWRGVQTAPWAVGNLAHQP